MGVYPVTVLNKALLAKWWWKFAKEKEALWRRVICNKYKYEEEAWFPGEIHRSNGSALWLDILRIGKEHGVFKDLLSRNLKIKVVDGMNTRFWKEVWNWEKSLKKPFPDCTVYQIRKKEALQRWGMIGASGLWSLEGIYLHGKMRT